MLEERFFVVRDWMAERPEELPALVAKSSGMKHWALILQKTKRAHFRNIGQDVHGIGKERYNRIVEFQGKAFAYGVTVYLGINDREAGEALFAPLHELAKRKFGCICSACRSGKPDCCQNEPGGMWYFPVSTFRPFGKLDNNKVIARAQRTVNEPEQISLF